MPRVVNEEADGTVSVDSIAIEGWLQEHSPCPMCGSVSIMHMEYDAAFCPQCNFWLESSCSDPRCEYCAQRPERPLPLSQAGET